MIVSLGNFSYYFSVTGGRGGLMSMDNGFQLRPDGSETDEDVKNAMRGLVQTHTRMFDRLFDGILQGKREPVLTDTPHMISTGYRYRGRLTQWSKARLEKNLAALFGGETVDPRGERSTVYDNDISIECAAHKQDGRFWDATVKTRYSLNHTLNVCFYRFIAKLDGIVISPETRVQMDALDRTLATGWEREGRDHFQAMVTKE